MHIRMCDVIIIIIIRGSSCYNKLPAYTFCIISATASARIAQPHWMHMNSVKLLQSELLLPCTSSDRNANTRNVRYAQTLNNLCQHFDERINNNILFTQNRHRRTYDDVFVRGLK